MTRKAIGGLVALIVLLAALAWWSQWPAEGCPEGMYVSGPVTDGATGNVIGAICTGPRSEVDHKPVEKPE